jgi:hypothetical protein
MAKKSGKRAIPDDVLEIKDVYVECEDAWSDHHNRFIDEYRFNRLNYQWDEEAKKARGTSRPMLTINKVNPIIKQIVNDCRQNKPSIKVRPADDGADPDTAEIYSGIILNIEQISGADAAYDTAVDCAASGGFGFFRVKLGYAYDDAFDLDILIDRIANPLSVMGDPWSTAVDSNDWNHAFITDVYSEESFKARWPDAEVTSWDGDVRSPSGNQGSQDVQVAEYWCRKEVPKTIVKLTNGVVMGEAEYLAQKDVLDAQGITVVASRQIKCRKVYQKILSGAEILEENDWPGIYIPIIPVYGDEQNDEGERIFRSAVWYAQDAQRKYNYWTTTSTELVALAPKVPYIGPEEAFTGEDAAKWANANSANYAYISYGGQTPPQRQPLDSGPAGGAMQEALVASDEIKGTTGVFDASMGNRSNETSGRAINARKVEGDTATYHFTDNLARGIKHCGRILIDLIPKVYKQDRIIRILGEDGHAQNVKLGQPQPTTEQPKGQRKNFDGVYDLGVGKYDLHVDTGPSYTTRRVETREEIMALIQAAPDVASRIADILAKNMDWKDADLIAERLTPPDQAQIPPEVQQQMDEMGQALQECQAQHEQEKSANLKGQGEIAKADVEMQKLAIEEKRLPIDEMQAKVELLNKQIELMNAQSASNATETEATASASEKNATAGAMAEFGQAVAAMSQALTLMQQGIADLQVKASVPRAKRGRAAKQPDGTWALDTVEMPQPTGAM